MCTHAPRKKTLPWRLPRGGRASPVEFYATSVRDPSSASSVSTFLRSFATTKWTRSFKLSVILRSLARSSIISLSGVVEIMKAWKLAQYITYMYIKYMLQRCAETRFYFTFLYIINIHSNCFPSDTTKGKIIQDLCTMHLYIISLSSCWYIQMYYIYVQLEDVMILSTFL